jgi:hypothetical protein
MGSIIVEKVRFVEARKASRGRPAVGIPIDLFTDTSMLGPNELRAIIYHQMEGGVNSLRMWLVGPRRVPKSTSDGVVSAPGRVVGVIQPGAFRDAREILDQEFQASWVESVLTDVLATKGGSVVLESPDRGNVQRETLLQWALPAGIREKLFPSSAEPAVA